MCSMIAAVHVPRLPLLVALLRARRPLDAPVALGPAPGAPQVVGPLHARPPRPRACGPACAWARRWRAAPGSTWWWPTRRRPPRRPSAPSSRLEAAGFAVEPIGLDGAAFDARGTLRLHGGLDGVLRRVRAALPVGADGRVGAAPSLFAALQAAREARARAVPWCSPRDEVVEFLAPLPGRAPAAGPRRWSTPCDDLGLRTMGQVAALPRAAALERLGFPGLARVAPRPRRGRPRPAPAHARRGRCGRRSPSPSPWRPCRPSRPAARLLLGELAAAAARARRRPARRSTLRARLSRRRIVGARPHPARGDGRPGPAGARGPPPARRDHRPGQRALDRRRRLRCARRPPADGHPLTGPGAPGHGPARPSARCAPPRGRRRCCGWWRSSPGRGCPSGAGPWPPTSRDAAGRWGIPAARCGVERGTAEGGGCRSQRDVWADAAATWSAVRDDWLVQDLWWTDRPVDRHYFELVLDPGRVMVAYRRVLAGPGSSTWRSAGAGWAGGENPTGAARDPRPPGGDSRARPRLEFARGRRRASPALPVSADQEGPCHPPRRRDPPPPRSPPSSSRTRPAWSSSETTGTASPWRPAGPARAPTCSSRGGAASLLRTR